jgi:hypothetical protein
MRWLSLAALLLCAIGCLESDAPDGTLTCSTVPGRLCPQNYYCAPDHTCWHNGDPFKMAPDFAFPFFNPGPPDDLSVPIDNGDMAIPIFGGDMAVVVDMSQPGD